jgi:hypothetical protein
VERTPWIGFRYFLTRLAVFLVVLGAEAVPIRLKYVQLLDVNVEDLLSFMLGRNATQKVMVAASEDIQRTTC